MFFEMQQEEIRRLLKMRRRGMYVYALPNLFTSANLLFGFLAIIAAAEAHFEKSAWAIVLAAVCDLLDGRVARLTQTTSKFGIEYDSLCDLVSFGLAPAITIYYASLIAFERVGLGVAILFAICGALRLARFNVFAAAQPKSYFEGLPIPSASLCIATLIFFSRELQVSLSGNVTVLILTAALALLMVSTIRFPSFKDTHFRHGRPLGLLAIVLTIFILLVAWFEISAFLLLLTYIISSVLTDLIRQIRKPKKLPV